MPRPSRERDLAPLLWLCHSFMWVRHWVSHSTWPPIWLFLCFLPWMRLPQHWSQFCQWWTPLHCNLAWYFCFCHWRNQLLIPRRTLCCLTCHWSICTRCIPHHQGLHAYQLCQRHCHYHPTLQWRLVEASHQVCPQFSLRRGWKIPHRVSKCIPYASFCKIISYIWFCSLIFVSTGSRKNTAIATKFLQRYTKLYKLEIILKHLVRLFFLNNLDCLPEWPLQKMIETNILHKIDRYPPQGFLMWSRCSFLKYYLITLALLLDSCINRLKKSVTN